MVAVAPPGTEVQVACDHCGLPVPESLVDSATALQFCCGGCAVAYETIHGCGLEDYYEVRERLASEKQSARGEGRGYAAYDSEAFLQRHARTTPAGYQSIDLRLDGVHCAACVWLIEKLPRVVPGVLEARLTLGANRARIVWDSAQVPLSTIAATLDRLGYAAYPARDASARSLRDVGERRRLVNLAIAGALAGNNMLIAIALYAGVFEGIEPQYARLFRWLSLAIGWISLVGPGRSFFRGALAAFRARVANLDVPIALALAVGAVAGTINVLLDTGEVYFDSLSALVFLLLLGRFLQARQQRSAEEAVGLMLSMTPDSCRIVRDGELIDSSIEALGIGDEFEVRPGELIPADGEVVRGASTINQSLLTGETLPVAVQAGGRVYAGAQNIASTLRVEVTATGDSTRVGKLVSMVEEGIAAKSPIVQLADRIAGWFVLVVVALSAINFAWWTSTVGLTEAIESSVALLIVACPCALGLATPLTMAVAIGRGAKEGILIKSAAVLEKLAEVRTHNPGTLLLDKTGTLTTGNLRVDAWHGDERLRPLVAALESESNHPIARALVSEYQTAEADFLPEIKERVEKHGYGVTATTSSGDLLVGSERFASQQRIQIDSPMKAAIERGAQQGRTIVVVAVNGSAAAVVWLADRVYEDCSARVDDLRSAGWRPQILSGDASGPVRQVAAEIGLQPELCRATVSPEEKLQHVRNALNSEQPVMMVGDGVNDAAALAAADISVAVHGGAEAALTAADVYLSEPGIGKLVDMVRLGRLTMRTARRNLAISLAYNLVAVALAMAGWITPLVAALLMPASSATVLASAIGLTWGDRGDSPCQSSS